MILIVPSVKCVVESCLSRRHTNGMCTCHYQRLRRNGSLNRKRNGLTRNGRGYAKILKPGHPLAGSDGYVYLHRFNLYQRIGPGWHICFYCPKPVTWSESSPESHRALVVDHRNDDKSDNRPENLVPCCQSCNAVQFHARKRARKAAACHPV